MEGAGDARLPNVPLGHFAPWNRNLGKGDGPSEEVMAFIRQSMMDEANKLQYVPDTSGGIVEKLERLDHAGLGYPYNYYDLDDEDDYEDSDDYTDDDGDSDSVPSLCGLKKHFLTGQELQSSMLSSNHPFINFTMPLQHRITPEEAEKNAKELVAEEERIKNKAEKKKLKKQRQKDRKRQQKLEEELKNKKKEIKNEKKKELEKGSGDVSSIKEGLELEKEKQGVRTSLGKEPPDSRQKGQSKNKMIVEASPKREYSDSEDTEESEEYDDAEEEPEAELDMESTFVNQVWRKVESKPKVERKEKIIKPAGKLPEKLPGKLEGKNKENLATINPMEQCIQFAALGNSMASGGHFAAAVVYFTEAIKLNPRDYRLFGNRSYCWERMGSYKEALGDAEVSLSLYPQFLKGYFRKGKSLMGMKRYMEAMVAFRHILQEDSTHVDAALELKECERFIQMDRFNSGSKMKMPDLVPMAPDFRLPSSVIPQDYMKVEAALSDLSLNGSRASSTVGEGPVLITTSGQKSNGPAAQGNPSKSTKEPVGAASSPIPPAVPSQLYPVWVGNVTPRITGAILLSHFQRYGAIHSIRILYDRTCAFINYPNKEAAEAAYSALQGAEVEGTKFILQLRHPDHAGTNPRTVSTSSRLTPKEGVKMPPEMECHFWRNAGCDIEERCRFRHVPENKGIDQK